MNNQENNLSSIIGTCWTTASTPTIEETKKSIHDIIDSWDNLPKFPEPMKLEVTSATLYTLKRMQKKTSVVEESPREIMVDFFFGYPVEVVEDAGPNGWRLVPMKKFKEPE